MDFKLVRSKKKGKKYTALFDNKTVHFGQAGASDFTKHKDEARKQRYIDRHRKRENWRDIRTAGALSRWLLWNKPTLEESVRDTERKFGIRIDAR